MTSLRIAAVLLSVLAVDVTAQHSDRHLACRHHPRPAP